MHTFALYIGASEAVYG